MELPTIITLSIKPGKPNMTSVSVLTSPKPLCFCIELIDSYAHSLKEFEQLPWFKNIILIYQIWFTYLRHAPLRVSASRNAREPFEDNLISFGDRNIDVSSLLSPDYRF